MSARVEAGASSAVSQNVLRVRDLAVTFPGRPDDVQAVRGIDFDLARGEVLGLVGESGCGKSATALAVTGLLPDSARVSGSVQLGGEELIGVDDDALSAVRGSRISIVFQDPLAALTPVFTIGRQVAEAVAAHGGVSREAANERAVELLDVVGIPDARTRAAAYPHEISGGQRQRVMIAIAIAAEPDVIVADEPTTALDVTVQAQVLDVLRRARELTGAAVLMISHDLALLAGFADRMAVMYAGRIVESAPVDDLFGSPRMPYTAGLLGAIPRIDAPSGRALAAIEGAPPALAGLPPGCPFAPRCPLAVDRCRVDEPVLETVGDGESLAACHRAQELASGRLGPAGELFVPDPVGEPREKDRQLLSEQPGEEELLSEQPGDAEPHGERELTLEVEGLQRHYPLLKGAIFKRQVGSVRAVDGISFELRDGETLALVGESGCGKTTTLMELLELARPKEGRIVVLGRPTDELSAADRRALRRELSVVFQDPFASLDPRMPVGDIVAEPLRAHGSGRAAAGIRVSELLELVGLEPAFATRYPRQLSGGQRQRVAIARALALEPRVVLLDEPVSSLDVSIQAGIVNLLAELRDRLGLSYLLVAHDLAVVRHVADRVAVMHLGRIVETGQVADVYGTPAHPYTQALLSAIPIPDPAAERARQRIILRGEPPSPSTQLSGCSFRTRCPLFATLGEEDRRPCVESDPQLSVVGAGQQAACHHARGAPAAC